MEEKIEDQSGRRDSKIGYGIEKSNGGQIAGKMYRSDSYRLDEQASMSSILQHKAPISFDQTMASRLPPPMSNASVGTVMTNVSRPP